jgi:PAS domain S-box-containing protein
VKSEDPVIAEPQTSSIEDAGQALARCEEQLKKKNQEAHLPKQESRIEQAETRADEANTRTEEANTRTEEANVRTDQANTRTDQANTRTEEANTRTDQANTRTDEAEARSAEAILASELRYRRLFETAQDGILILDADTGQVVDANPFMKDLLGYSQDEFLGKKLWEIGPFKGAADSRNAFAELQLKDRIRYEGLPLETKDGRRVEVEFISSAYLVDKKRLIQCNIRDITERSQTEDQLRASFKEIGDLKSALDDHAIVAITDPQGKITYVNDKFCAISKYSREELLGQDHRIINSNFHPKGFIRDLWATITHGKVWKGEIKNRAKDGSFYWVDTTIVPFLNEDGKPRQYVAIRADITERKRAEEELKASLKEVNDLKAALDEHAIVAMTNPQGKITYVNDKFCSISKYSREELLGQDHRIINSGYHSKQFIGELWTTIAHGNVWHGEIKNRAKDGSYYWVDTTIVPFLNEDGKPRQYVAIRADITERKRAEEEIRSLNTGLEQRVAERTIELQSAKEQAESADRMKSEFLANMSHELRTPLNGIIGFSEFLIDGKTGALTAKQTEYVTDIFNSGRHLLQLINDVLDLAKVEAGKMDLHPETFSLGKAIEEVCSVIGPLALQKTLAISREVEPSADEVTLDRQKLKQVLFNLLSNAVKFTDNGGAVKLIADLYDESRLRLRVQDSGIGIKPEDLDKLFIEFRQLDSGVARRHQGTGLGLALTKKIVQFQNGTIEVESKPGKGSTFTVILPRVSRKKIV